jgi:protein TonB
MKTKDEKKVVPSFDELVFENRNKEYGAYQIRRKYKAALIWSILISVFFISATVITPFVIEKGKSVKVVTMKDGTKVIFEGTQIPVDVPKPDPPKPEPVNSQISRYVAPRVVDSIPLQETNQFQTMDQVKDSLTNGDVVDVVNVDRPEIDPDVDIDKALEVFQLSEKPLFGIGGDDEFRNWVAKNIVYPQIPLDNGIQGKVFLQFVVEKDGSLSNIKVVKTIDPELGSEAVRVLESSPKWNPGKQQGNPVRVNYNFMITFSIR